MHARVTTMRSGSLAGGVAPSADALQRMLHPRSVALVGASDSLRKTGGRRLRSLIQGSFPGAIYPVNPKAVSIQGLPAYPDLASIPHPVDLAVIAVPIEHVGAVIDQGIQRGVAGFICITAGYAEAGSEGTVAQNALAERVRAAGARLIGPNCNGVYIASERLNVTTATEIPAGPVGLITQSGNVGTAFIHMARTRRGGIGAVLTIGNAADVGAADLLRVLEGDPAVRVICLYLEGFAEGEGERFLDAASGVSRRKPILAVQAGRTLAGRRAVRSHTGVLAADDAAVSALFESAGVIRVRDLDDAFDAACALAVDRSPAPATGAVVIADSGGPAALAADGLTQVGVELAGLSDATRSELAALLPSWSAMGNPIDLAGMAEAQPRSVAATLRICLADPSVGAALIVGHFGGYGRATGGVTASEEMAAAEEIGALSQQFDKPVVVHSIYARETDGPWATLVRDGVRAYETVGRACEVIGGLFRAGEIRRRPKVRLTSTVMGAGRSIGRATRPRLISEPDARSLLARAGFEIPAWRVATTEAEALTAFRLFSGRLAAKLVSADIAHKSDVGGVVLNVASAEEAREAFARIVGLGGLAATGRIDGVIFTEMLDGPVELAAGYVADPHLGPLVMIGSGGTLVELLRDVSIRPARIVQAEGPEGALRMLRTLRAWPLVSGVRGRPALEIGPVIATILALSRLTDTLPEVIEVDLNPIILDVSSARIADVRVTIAEPIA